MILFRLAIIISILFGITFQLSAQSVPRFEPSDCAIQIPKGEKVECGYLIVPEDRTIKNNKTIKLPIAILKSDNPNPQPDPVLRTLGGPGGSSLRMVTGRRFSPWLKQRDMVIFEQRGTKYSQPALECPEVSEAKINSAKAQLNPKKTKEQELKAVKVCRDRLTKEGINLVVYNSTQSAADIEDLRQVLKFEKINLYGVSYSARLMLNVMRDFPNGIRTVVLESTMPLEINYDELGVTEIVRSLDLFFGKCAQNPDCNAAFPNLEPKFYDLVKKTNVEPIVISVKDQKSGENFNLKLIGDDLVTWLVDYSLSSDGNTISEAPLKIQAVINGDYTPLKDYAESKLQPDFYSLGMRYSVWCREEIPFENRSKIAAQSNLFPKLKGYEVQSLPDVCRIWKIPPAKKIENEPVKSNIPTLIMAGEYDAYTPPEWGKMTAANLKNSFFVEVPWAGHGPGFNSPLCVNEMIADFLNDPASAPKTTCLDKINKIFKFKTKKS
ncbi:MAG: alpha/beta hydrolase [Pyrinomonadaceae bacterium]|nr:alpha/beta hydrolase [Pyrinomonadaceae bacterium]